MRGLLHGTWRDANIPISERMEVQKAGGKESPLRVSGQETQENRDMDRDRPRGKLTSICGALGSADGRKKSSNL